ncbi:hypothetical protein [Helicobacter kayseriensis]|uniref:hypothetical protein n=1 Tax=Helicobacter kayseriensis TaxID=2905877 RepID=UPI001E402279|nr:hypothetical protein [Helicobacter kayseriensis]MCE3046766.1 hypothetical protein [Helicobacter kayseriensis]MCE3047932.1 hypothetical protein [Helicobacter kayseriensis]
MSLKEDFRQAKEELSNDEKMLESAFKIEAFVKKNKKILLGLLALGAICFGGYQLKTYLDERRALKITKIFSEIQQNGQSEELMQKLKKEGGELYEFMQLSRAIEEGNQELLEQMQHASNPFVSKYACYELASLTQTFDSQKDYGAFKDLVLLQEGYLMISKKDFQKASKFLNEVALTSEFKDWALRIGHYGIAH